MLVQIITAVAPILVAVVAIIPTVISNRKKTQTSIEDGQKATEKRIDKIQDTLTAHIREDEDNSAKNRRTRILRFYDEMCEGKRHSENHFEDIMDDIDSYRLYCDKHPDYKNGRGKIAMKYIEDSYHKLKKTGGFLTHKEV